MVPTLKLKVKELIWLLGGDLMMASSQRYTQAAVVLRLNLSENHNYITCFGIDLVEEINEEEALLDLAARTAATKSELGGALGAKDIPAELMNAVGRLEAERGSRLVIERSKTDGEREQFGAWYCMRPSIAYSGPRCPWTHD